MKRARLLHNEAGFTLIELMAAMVIMLVGLMGLLQSVNVATETNLKNQMRNEVSRVAQENMNAMRSQPFDTVPIEAAVTVPSQLRNINRSYNVNQRRFNINSQSARYQVDVRWKYKNVSTTYSVTSVRSKNDG